MFLCAKACLRKINGVLWDGKYGIWPDGHFELSQRASKNRPARTPVWRTNSVDRQKYCKLMINCILPASLESFPLAYLEWHGVKIQQDGAKCHIMDHNLEWL